MERLQALENEVRPILQEFNYDIVRAAVINESDNIILQIMIDKLDFKEVSVNDCAFISKKLSVLFDYKPPLKGAYQLEVSSPGTERPLTRFSDFEIFSGSMVNIKVRNAIDNKKNFSGVLKGITENKEVTIISKKKEIKLLLENIIKANLVFN